MTLDASTKGGRQNLAALHKLIGNKARLDLLYDSRTSGFDPAAFHQQCDNKGPTVSVAVLADGTVCGGYRQTPFSSRGVWSSDPAAFLFRLRLKGQLSPIKTTQITQPQNTVCDHPSHVSYFGAGPDLLLFDSAGNGSHNPHSFAYPAGSRPLTGGILSLKQP
eukprot:1579882-Prymnesium_polylepis.1